MIHKCFIYQRREKVLSIFTYLSAHITDPILDTLNASIFIKISISQTASYSPVTVNVRSTGSEFKSLYFGFIETKVIKVLCPIRLEE